MQTDPSIPPSSRLRVESGSLYIVSMPIGDIEDITVRALRILKEVSLIAVENVAVTRAILRRYNIDTPLISCRPRVGARYPESLMVKLAGGESVALVVDAGTPLVADPGLALARTALKVGAPLVAVPGPTAAMAALVVSGLASGRFAFDGFPPRGRSDRAAFFAGLADERRTLLLYESRSHLHDTLRRLCDTLGGSRQSVVARNLTRDSESIFYGLLDEAVASFTAPLAGEYALVIAAPSARSVESQKSGELTRIEGIDP